MWWNIGILQDNPDVINPWQLQWVNLGDWIKYTVVYTKPERSILLSDKDNGTSLGLSDGFMTPEFYVVSNKRANSSGAANGICLTDCLWGGDSPVSMVSWTKCVSPLSLSSRLNISYSNSKA